MHLTDIDIIKELSDKIKGLPEDNIREVIDFIEFLKSKKENREKGSPEVILKHFGNDIITNTFTSKHYYI